MKLSLRRTGSALVLALIAFLFMAGIGGAIFSLTLAGQHTTITGSFGDGAYHIAEAGIDDAINKMRGYLANPLNGSADFAVIGETVEVDGVKVNVVKGTIRGGTYFVTITPPVDNTVVQNYTVKSIGELLQMRRGITTYVVTEKVEVNNKFGLFGDVYLDTGGNIKTDGYKSIDVANNNAPLKYEDQYTKEINGTWYANMTGHVGSNGNVDVSGNSTIYGNATPGPNSSVTGSGSVHGSTAPAPENLTLTLEDLTPPAGLTLLPGVTKGDSFGKDNTDTVVRVESVSPSGQSTVEIYGNVTMYVEGDFVFTGGPTLHINKGATLTVYQNAPKAKFNIAGSSVVNETQLPQSLLMYTNTASGKLTGDSNFYGVINAPTTEMAILGTAGLFGATIAKSIDVQGTPFFHYDETLGLTPTFKLKVNVNAIEQFQPGTDTSK